MHQDILVRMGVQYALPVDLGVDVLDRYASLLTGEIDSEWPGNVYQSAGDLRLYGDNAVDGRPTSFGVHAHELLRGARKVRPPQRVMQQKSLRLRKKSFNRPRLLEGLCSICKIDVGQLMRIEKLVVGR